MLHHLLEVVYEKLSSCQPDRLGPAVTRENTWLQPLDQLSFASSTWAPWRLWYVRWISSVWSFEDSGFCASSFLCPRKSFARSWSTGLKKEVWEQAVNIPMFWYPLIWERSYIYMLLYLINGVPFWKQAPINMIIWNRIFAKWQPEPCKPDKLAPSDICFNWWYSSSDSRISIVDI